jgi:hypothetical protein
MKTNKMKNASYYLFLVVLTLQFAACKKDKELDITLNATKTAFIKRGEPVLFSMVSSTGSNQPNWSVYPANNVKISPSGNNASIVFANPGSYKVLAVAENMSSSVIVTVIDSIYNAIDTTGPDCNKEVNTVLSLAGDQIILTPYVYGSGTPDGDTTFVDTLGFRINASTVNNYNCLYASLNMQAVQLGKDYSLTFSDLHVVSITCWQPQQRNGYAIHDFERVAKGTHQFSVVLNGVTYTGSFVKTAENKYKFTWPYSSGVTMSVLTL